MPNGLWYARGPKLMKHAIAASAFSKGDLLIFDSSSSLSRMAETFASGADIAGVAVCDSTQSVNGFIPYLVPLSDTQFWSRLSSNVASHFTPGRECDITYTVADGRYEVDSSATTSRAVIVEGTVELDQSGQSRVIMKFITHAGNLDIS